MDYENCKYRKKSLINWLKNVEEVKIAKIVLFERGNECVCSYTICIVLAVIALAISIGIGAYFVFSRWLLKKDVKLGTSTRTTI